MRQVAVAEDLCIAAMAIDAAQPHCRRFVHRRLVGADMAGNAARRFRRHLRLGLDPRRRRGGDEAVVALDRSFLLRRAQAHGPGEKHEGDGQQEAGKTAHQ